MLLSVCNKKPVFSEKIFVLISFLVFVSLPIEIETKTGFLANSITGAVGYFFEKE